MSQPEGSLSKRLDEACACVKARFSTTPDLGLVLGSGLGAFADGLQDAERIPYGDIPHMPSPSVSGHAGKLCLGTTGETVVACLQGRVHMYEGQELDRVVFGVRLLGRLGCRAVLLTNAAGGVRRSFLPGSLMLIRDHINLTGRNPLMGPNDDALGPRFPDMSCAYDAELAHLALAAAADIGCTLDQGIYAALLGPTYETPAEVQMMTRLGADAVGMSTVPEVIALRHMGVPVGAISCITNMAAGLTAGTLNHAEVEETADATRETFTNLLASWIARISKDKAK